MDYGSLISTIPPLTSPAFVWAIVFVVMILTAIMTAVLFYHWYKFNTGEGVILISSIIYSIVLITLLFSVLIVAYKLTSI